MANATVLELEQFTNWLIITPIILKTHPAAKFFFIFGFVFFVNPLNKFIRNIPIIKNYVYSGKKSNEMKCLPYWYNKYENKILAYLWNGWKYLVNNSNTFQVLSSNYSIKSYISFCTLTCRTLFFMISIITAFPPPPSSLYLFHIHISCSNKVMVIASPKRIEFHTVRIRNFFQLDLNRKLFGIYAYIFIHE